MHGTEPGFKRRVIDNGEGGRGRGGFQVVRESAARSILGRIGIGGVWRMGSVYSGWRYARSNSLATRFHIDEPAARGNEGGEGGNRRNCFQERREGEGGGGRNVFETMVR